VVDLEERPVTGGHQDRPPVLQQSRLLGTGNPSVKGLLRKGNCLEQLQIGQAVHLDVNASVFVFHLNSHRRRVRLIPRGREQHGTAADDDAVQKWNDRHAVRAEHGRFDAIDARARRPDKATVQGEFGNSARTLTIWSLGLVGGENAATWSAQEAVEIVHVGAGVERAKETRTLGLAQIESERSVACIAVCEQDPSRFERMLRMMWIKGTESNG
jgi:hypothetical protein